MGLRTFFYQLSGDREWHVIRHGIKYQVRANDFIGLKILKRGVWEQDQTNYLVSLCQRYDANYFFDIGAYFGYYSVLLNQHLDLKHCYALEPSPVNYDKLRTHIDINGLSNIITTYQVAASDTTKEAVDFWLHDPNNAGCSTLSKNDPSEKRSYTGKTKVDIKRLDMFDFASIEQETIAIKIDTEGHEMRVLRGGMAWFKKNRCILQVEIFDHNVGSVGQYLEENGFKLDKSIGSDHYYLNFD